jgi:predicted O-methyltransferase YrrM
MRNFLRKALHALGYEIRRIARSAAPAPAAAPASAPAPAALIPEIPDFDRLAQAAAGIPSMLGQQTAFALYTLCYLQELAGDVVEIGSWQGYSTSFLAQAVRDSGNGTLYAIDHFKGNVGKERFYVVGRPDLSDLRQGFEDNLRRVGVRESVRLLDMPNEEAIRHLDGVRVRLLFIDGDHTREGVEKDIRLFFPLVLTGGLVVFDDFSPNFPGLIEAVEDLVKTQPLQRAFAYRNTLVLRK